MVLLAAYALATAVMTRPYVNYADFAGASYAGDSRLIIWTLAWDNHAVLESKPLFDANVFYPASEALRYNEHLFGLSLFTLPWAAAGASPVFAYNVTWWLAFLLNGLAAHALLRRFVQSDLAAFTGALAYACSFYVMLHAHGHLHLIWIWPLPASLLLLERWFDEPRVGRVAAWLAVVLIEALTSWYLAVMVIVANGIMMMLVMMLAAEGRPASTATPLAARLWRRRLVQLVGASVVAVSCLYPFARHYAGLRSSGIETAAFAADVASYLIPPENTIAGRWWLAHVDRRPRSIWGEQTLFTGWVALTFASLGLVVLWRGGHASRRAWVFTVLALVGFLLSLGPSPPLLGGSALAPFQWLSALPGFDGMRVPARFAVLVTLGVSGLVAIGAAALLRVLGTRGRVLIVAAAPLMLLEWFVVDFPGGKPVPLPVPLIYLTPEVRAARSLVSLPDYDRTPESFKGADYLYYSTAHWRPIVNGQGRAEPALYQEVIRSAHAFPDDAAAMRHFKVQYVVLHADRFPDHARDMIAAAELSSDYRLAARIGADYLFEIVDK